MHSSCPARSRSSRPRTRTIPFSARVDATPGEPIRTETGLSPAGPSGGRPSTDSPGPLILCVTRRIFVPLEVGSRRRAFRGKVPSMRNKITSPIPVITPTYSNSYNPYNEVCSFNNNGLCVEDSANTSSYSRDYQDNKNARDRREIDSKEGNGSYKRSGYSYSHTEEKTDGDQETDFYNQSDSGGFPSVNSYPYRSYNRKSRYSTPGMYLRGSYEPTGSPFSAPTSYYYGDSYSPSLLGSCVGDSGECPTPSVWLRFPSPSG
ncbi:hypothetical protein M8J75_009860 [Diaphorina citri]|nr:hypothetical protein M8J75_009860 [Diaphorina citri]